MIDAVKLLGDYRDVAPSQHPPLGARPACSSPLDTAAPSGARALSFAAVTAIVLHGGLVLSLVRNRVERTSARPRSVVTEMIDIDKPFAPPAPTAVSIPTPPARPAPRARREATPEAAPAAARAAQVLAARDEVVDFGDAFVAGTSATYAGGATTATGTASRAVRSGSIHPEGGQGVGSGPAADHSRPPRLAGAAEWACPFPPEADDAGVDHASVRLGVAVGAHGDVGSVRALSDPGNGFAREARRCAMSKRWLPGLDRDGLPVAATVVVNVSFDR
ncbi:MAG TPA: energy transducer TonB [Polyangiaceae bacterium]|nr:energy transducer TonB [Polyangiaceae bacterium]